MSEKIFKIDNQNPDEYCGNIFHLLGTTDHQQSPFGF